MRTRSWQYVPRLNFKFTRIVVELQNIYKHVRSTYVAGERTNLASSSFLRGGGVTSKSNRIESEKRARNIRTDATANLEYTRSRVDVFVRNIVALGSR